MPTQEKDRRVGDLIRTAVNPTQAELQEQKAELDCEIRQFESRYKISSGEMQQRLANGELREAADICSWLMLLKIRGQLESKFGSPRA
jgi:hypothetical protein